MKIPFKFAINRIEDKYLFVSADDEKPAKVVVCCDEVSAHLMSLLTEDLTQNEMLEFAKGRFADVEEAVLLEKVKRVRDIVRSFDSESDELEVTAI